MHRRAAYYLMTDISGFGFENDVAFAKHLIENVGIAAVRDRVSSMIRRMGAQALRFLLCKRDETLEAARDRLRRL